jgi:predicted phage terminase large subunit-like protein
MKHGRLALDEYLPVLRNDFYSFAERCFYELNPQTPLVSAPYIEMIASKLEACRQGRCKRLIINLPPRSLKSHLASVAFPAWWLAHRPSEEVVCVSYAQDLSDKFARDSRRIMNSRWFRAVFPVRLADRTAVADFMTTEQGVRFATSVGGQFTGRGADVIIIDDPMKPDEALSETQRKSTLEWFDNTLRSRLNHKAEGCIIIVMQRLHQDDLVSHVLEQEPWEVLALPAIAERTETHLIQSPLGNSVYRRSVGEVLHPARESLETIKKMRKTISEYTFASQYQQNPTPVSGNLVKREWLRYYQPGEEPARFERIVQSWDTANKASELSDFSVCTTWGVIDNVFYLCDVYRDRLNYPALKRKVVELQARFGADTVVIEDKASGTQLIQDLKEEGHYGVEPYEPPPGNNKMMRLHAQTTMFENGFVRLPAEAPWLAEYEAELLGFPNSRHKDQVDSTTQGLAYVRVPNGLATWSRLGMLP